MSRRKKIIRNKNQWNGKTGKENGGQMLDLWDKSLDKMIRNKTQIANIWNKKVAPNISLLSF